MQKKIIVESDDISFSEDEQDSLINSITPANQESDFEKQCELLLNKISDNYKEQRDDIKNLMKLHKKEMRNIKGNKRQKSGKSKTGFTKPSIVPDKLAEFVGINKGTEMARTDLTKLIFQEFQRRELYHKQDRRIIIPDDDVIKLFNLSKESQKSNNPKDKNGLNIFSIQKFITQIYNEVDNNKQINNKQINHKQINNSKQVDDITIYTKNFNKL